MNRRDFIKKASLALALGGAAPSLLGRTALAATQKGRALVVIQLSGGNDALNTLVPYKDPLYKKLRPNLALPAKDVLDLDGHQGLHPALRPLLGLYERGQVALIPQVGYPRPSRSHFVSMAVWHTADPEKKALTGWLGRYLDEKNDPFCAVDFGVSTPLALRGEHVVAPAMPSLERFDLHLSPTLEAAFRAELNKTYAGLAAEVQTRLRELDGLVKRVKRLPRRPAAGLEGRLGKSLADVLAWLAAEDAPQVYYTSLGGFDTHANQPPRQEALLAEFAAALQAFFRELKGMGREKDVLVLVFSEFGRRVAENGSGGTDHGKAGLSLLLGAPVAGGIKGEPPDLLTLDVGDLPMRVDFRRFYADALGFLGADVERVLGSPFAPLGAVPG